MRILSALALLLLTACPGTFVADVQTSYALSPARSDFGQGAEIIGHIGGSSLPGIGIGLSAGARAMNHGFVIPELGPQVFVLAENDTAVAPFARAGVLVGFAGLHKEYGPSFSGRLNAGVLIYPAVEPLFLSVSLVGELTLAPVGSYHRGWLGLSMGIGFGGQKE